MNCLQSLTVYETRTRLYVIGTDAQQKHYRILKIDRTTTTTTTAATTTNTTPISPVLSAEFVVEDEAVYTREQLHQLLTMINEGNKGVGGGLRRLLVDACGIVGFVRFLEGYYVYFITKRTPVAVLGGHVIYRIDDTALLPLASASASTGPGSAATDRNPNEQRYVDVFLNIDLTKNFYFSYTYDLTHTLQHNMTSTKQSGYQDMFIWNHYLLQTGFRHVRKQSPWILPLLHGFLEQARISVMGRTLLFTLIARRSRHFAGARFLKRGVNDQGHVANEVESEQIVHDASAGSLSKNTRFSSYVQHRGSIPLFWSQEVSNMTPKPPIQLNVTDPYYSAAALHFDDMLQRYGAPIVVLNLVKHKEATRRESILLEEYTNAIKYLNQFLPEEHRFKYIAFDMGRAAKSADQDAIGILEKIAQHCIDTTQFFHSGPEPYFNVLRRGDRKESYRLDSLLQHGIVRTNCIDCLDRTNAAQFLLGKCALARQLHALGFLEVPELSFDSPAVKTMMDMYHDHGDIIALQYGGSALVNTMDTYLKTSAWTSQSRDMIETVKRYYSNSFTDAEKQDAINLFLGNFVSHQDRPSLWELETDYYLHNEDPRAVKKQTRSYIDWYTPEHLVPSVPILRDVAFSGLRFEDVHRVREYTSFDHSLLDLTNEDARRAESPFVDAHGTVEVTTKKWLRIPKSDSSSKAAAVARDQASPLKSKAGSSAHADLHTGPLKSSMQCTTEVLLDKLRQPRVSEFEANEYERYVKQFGKEGKVVREGYSSMEGAHDETLYTAYVEEARIVKLDWDPVSPHDRSLYQQSVDIAKNGVPVAGNVRRSSAAAYQGYRRWLETGKYSIPQHQQSVS